MVSSTDDMGPWDLCAKDVAGKFGVSERTIRGWARMGFLSAKRAGPKLWRFCANQIEALVSEWSAQNASHGGKAPTLDDIKSLHGLVLHEASDKTLVFVVRLSKAPTPDRCERMKSRIKEALCEADVEHVASTTPFSSRPQRISYRESHRVHRED
jgi:hypothetical protein